MGGGKSWAAVGLPVFVKLAREHKILSPSDKGPSKDSLYRLFKRYGLEKDTRFPEDRRRFETELVNDLWQSDSMHGPFVIVDGKLRKAYLFAVIDDHSRLIACSTWTIAPLFARMLSPMPVVALVPRSFTLAPTSPRVAARLSDFSSPSGHSRATRHPS